MTLRTLIWSIPVAVVLLQLASCTNDPANDPAVEAVRDSITAVDDSGRSYKSGVLAGGTAVLVGTSAAYWVHDGTVYAVNGIAKSWSPSLSYSSSSDISLTTVERAISGIRQETHLETLLARTPEQIATDGRAELERCVDGGSDCDYELVARAYDEVVSRTIALPNSTAEGMNIVMACIALQSGQRTGYVDDETLKVAKNVLERDVCEGDIENYYKVEL